MYTKNKNKSICCVQKGYKVLYIEKTDNSMFEINFYTKADNTVFYLFHRKKSTDYL